MASSASLSWIPTVFSVALTSLHSNSPECGCSASSFMVSWRRKEITAVEASHNNHKQHGCDTVCAAGLTTYPKHQAYSLFGIYISKTIITELGYQLGIWQRALSMGCYTHFLTRTSTWEILSFIFYITNWSLL